MIVVTPTAEMLEAAQSDEALTGREMVRFSHERIEEHFKPSSATSGSLYDLIFANASLQWCDGAVPALMARMLARVRPGGSLAVQMPRPLHDPHMSGVPAAGAPAPAEHTCPSAFAGARLELP